MQREIIETERNLEDLERQARETSSVLGSQMQAAGAKIKEVGGKVTSAGQAMMPVTTAIAGIGAAAVKTTADFDASMSKVSAVSGATGEDFDRLREKARQMGRDTKFSAAEAADAMNYMAMAGWDTEDMLNSIDGVMNLAAASGEDLASVSDIVTDAMTAFGLAADGTSKVLKDGIETEVSNATRFVDVLAQTSRSSNTDVAMMGETFKYIAPVAGAMGYSVEDAALMIGLMANSGIKGAQAGTSLRSVLTNLAKPSDDLKILMQELGISLDDGNGNMLSLVDVADQLRGAFGELKISQEDFNNSLSELDEQLAAEQITEKEYGNELERLMERAYGAEGALNASAAATIAGKYGMSGLLAMTNATDEEFEELKESIYNSSGAAEEMSKTMQDNLSGQLTILKSQLAEAAIAIGDTLIPAIREITSKIQEWVDKFNGLSDGQKKAIVAIGLIVAAIGPLLIIIGTLISSVGSIVGGMGSLITFITGTLIPAISGVSAAVLVIPAAIAAVIAFGVLLYKNWDTIKEKAAELIEKISGAWENIKTAVIEKVADVKDSIANIFTMAKETVSDVWETIKNTIIEKIETIKKTVIDIFTSVKETVSIVWETIKNVVLVAVMLIAEIISAAFQIITLPWRMIWENTKEYIFTAWEEIKTTISNGIEAVSQIMNLIGAAIGGVWEEVHQVVSETLNKIMSVVSTGFEVVKETVSEVMDTVMEVVKSIWEDISSAISIALDTVKAVISEGFNTAKDVITIMMSTIREVIGNIWESIKTAISAALNTIKTTVSNGFNAAKTIVSNVMENIKSSISQKLQAGYDTVSGILGNIKNKFTDIFDNVKNIVKNAIDKIKSYFNFNWSLPKLKMPHFNISGSFSLNPPSVPHFSVQWYRKAMDEAYILKGASIFGQMNGKLLGGGESGSEIVAGKQYMMDLIRDATAQSNQEVAAAVGNLESRVVDIMAEYFPIFAEKGETEQYIKLDPHFSVMVGNRQFENYIVQTAEKGISGQQRSYRKAKGVG